MQSVTHLFQFRLLSGFVLSEPLQLKLWWSPAYLDFEWLAFLAEMAFPHLDSFWSVLVFQLLLPFCLNWLFMLNIKNQTKPNKQQQKNSPQSTQKVQWVTKQKIYINCDTITITRNWCYVDCLQWQKKVQCLSNSTVVDITLKTSKIYF